MPCGVALPRPRPGGRMPPFTAARMAPATKAGGANPIRQAWNDSFVIHIDLQYLSQLSHAAKNLGARLCVEHQPQHGDYSHTLQLVLRTQPRSSGCGSVSLRRIADF